MQIEFVNYDDTFFNKSKYWLADPEIKRLTMTPDLADDEQRLSWFQSLKQRADYLIWGITADKNPIGAVGIKNIDKNAGIGEYWGYIGEKEYIGRGIGRKMVDAMIDNARNIGLNALILKVANYNQRAFSLYIKMGFEIEIIDGHVYKMKRSL